MSYINARTTQSSFIVLILSSALCASAFAWRLSEPKAPPSDPNDPFFGKPAEEVLQSPYVGPYQFKAGDELFPPEMPQPNETADETKAREDREVQRKLHADYYTHRMFSTELQLPGATLQRYYVPDLQYDVIASDEQGNILPNKLDGSQKQPGLRLIPVDASSAFVYRVPLIHVGNTSELEDIREHYAATFTQACTQYGVAPTERVYSEQFVHNLLELVKAFQQDPSHHIAAVSSDLLSDDWPENNSNPGPMAKVMMANREASIGTKTVEDYAHLIAYGSHDDATDPLHIITPHTSSEEWFFNSVSDLISPNAKPQTSIHHVTGFYRFAGQPENSRRAMLSEGEPTNLRMVFTKAPGANAVDAIKATQLNLSLWFTLYYENPEGYFFAENYQFDDSYMTNLEEVLEMGHGWLNHDYVRKEFNKSHAVRIANRFKALMAPVDQIADPDEKANTPVSVLDTANQNMWQIRALITLLYGNDASAKFDQAQQATYKIENTIRNSQNVHNIKDAAGLLSSSDKKAVRALLTLLKQYEKGAEAAAAKLPYYTLLQKEAALAEYCNEGVKDQTDKGINIPLTHTWLSKIYGTDEGNKMFDTAERSLCRIQISRANLAYYQGAPGETPAVVKAKQDAFNAALAKDPCGVAKDLVAKGTKIPGDANNTLFQYQLLSDLEPILNNMTPVFTLPGMITGGATFTADQPLDPIRDENGNPASGQENAQRDHDFRLIGNSLAYGPQTTLNIVANLTKAYLPFYKAGAFNSAVVAASFLPEHNRRTGISTDTYVNYAGQILGAIYAGEGKIFRTKFNSDDLWNAYKNKVAGLFSTQIPAVIKQAIAAQQNDFNQGQDNVPAFTLTDAQISAYAAQLYAPVKAALDSATADAPAVVAAQGPLYAFNVYNTAIDQVDAIVLKANQTPTVVPNAIDNLYAGKKRVKFYYQPGLNSLDHMLLVKRNPNVLIEDIGTAVDKSQVVTKNPAVDGKQYIDQQIDNGLMHQEIVNFVTTSPVQGDLDKFHEGMFPNSIVGRDW